MRFPGLSTHHITKAGRVHTPTNLIRLCQRCHDCAEGLDTPIWLPDGTKFYMPKLTVGQVMWLKRHREPGQWDGIRMRELHMRPLPDLVPVPVVFLAEYLARTGMYLVAREGLRGTDFPGTVEDLLNSTMLPDSCPPPLT